MNADAAARPGTACLLRRFLVFAVLMFWQGGFVFYAGVVVPVAMSVLRPPSAQSFVTMAVTRYLNFAGIAALALLALDVFLTRDLSARRSIRWTLWGIMAAALAVLFWLHPRLAALMDPAEQIILDKEALYPIHRYYLLVSTGQWLCATIFIFLMLRSWQEEDRRTGKGEV